MRLLGPENDRAFALLNTLDEDQRRQAILKYRVADLVLGPGHDGQTIQHEGLQASAMNERQRVTLLDLIAQWAGIATLGRDFGGRRLLFVRGTCQPTVDFGEQS